MTAEVQPVPFNPMKIVASNSEGRGSESQWFDSERFLDPNFNAEQYVADLRRYVRLPDLPCYVCIYADALSNAQRNHSLHCLRLRERCSWIACEYMVCWPWSGAIGDSQL